MISAALISCRVCPHFRPTVMTERQGRFSVMRPKLLCLLALIIRRKQSRTLRTCVQFAVMPVVCNLWFRECARDTVSGARGRMRAGWNG